MDQIIIQCAQEKDVIVSEETRILKSRTDAFISAINNRDIDFLESLLAPDVETRSTVSDTVLTGDAETLGYFNRRFWMLRRNDPINVVAAAGYWTDSYPGGPCAVLFDGMRKSNIVTLRLNESYQVRTIAFSSDESDLTAARLLTPPNFPATPVIPESRT